METNNQISDIYLIEELRKRLKNYRKTTEEIQEINNKLTEVNKKLHESEKLKSHFISRLANEIINPFTVISSASHSLINMEKTNVEEVNKLVKFIFEESTYLDFQFKNIFAAAEIEAGKSKPLFSNTNIINLISSIIKKYEQQFQSKNIKFEFNNLSKDTQLSIITDNEKISLILINLINNSVKFSKKNSKIIISLSKLNKKVSISIKDFGKGISEKKKEIIFDRFSHEQLINSSVIGSGLGLSICKFYAEQINAKLLFESTKDIGSEFILLLSENKEQTNLISKDDNKVFFDDFEIF